MAAVSITTDEVALETGNLHAQPRAVANESVLAGRVVCLLANGECIHASAANTQDDANACGLALNSAEAGQAVTFQTTGVIDLGASAGMTVGKVYYLYADGQICPESDLSQGDYTTVIGVAETARLLRIAINATGIERA